MTILGLPPRLTHWFHSDRQVFDEVRIVTVPRWKESELSGSEWRISARIQLLKKGIVLYEEGFRDVETAGNLLAWVMVNAAENKIEWPEKRLANFCDQEGCAVDAVYFFRIKKHFCVGGGNCGQEQKHYDGNFYVQFCERHKHRGDCGLEDADDNYEEIPKP